MPTLVALAAGLGSRYGGLKQLDGVGPSGESLLDYAVYDAVRAGFDRVVFVIRREFEAQFRSLTGRRHERRVEVRYAFQQADDLPGGRLAPAPREKPWGTAHATWSARAHLDRPFLVINGDDFYGPGSYRLAAAELSRREAAPTEYALVGWPLARTLSEHGRVARGICSVDEDGWLQSVVEHTRIGRAEPGGPVTGARPDGTEVVLAEDTPVSMNFWALRPAAVGQIEEALAAFVVERGVDPRAECYLPAALDAAVRAGRARLRLRPTAEPWLGLTFRQDRPAVEAALRAAIAAGTYPERIEDGA